MANQENPGLIWPATRRLLPSRRSGETIDIRHGNTTYAVCVGRFPASDEPAEVFISGAKVGSDIDGLARDAAVVLSIALQYGVPLRLLAEAITRTPGGAPMTIVGAILDQLTRKKPPAV